MKDILLNENEIKEICQRVGKEISLKLKNEDRIPLLVGVMKGSLNFMIELMKYIEVPFYTDYIQISSYYGTQRSNIIRLLKDVSYDCTNRSVVIVEDIVDTGHSMNFLIDHIKRHQAKNVYVCTLIDKKVAREVEVPIDFTGFVLDRNRFLIGFGLDYSELERNLPYIYEADEEDVARLKKILDKDGDKYVEQ